jgi:alpha-amylase
VAAAAAAAAPKAVVASVEEAAAAATEGAVKVAIAVRRETQPGQDVWVVGSLPALGEWDLEKALALTWTEGHVWRATIEVAPATAVEYKAVLKNGDGSMIWEGGENQAAEAPAAGAAEPVELFHEFQG